MDEFALFACLVVVMLVEPGVTRRKHAASLKALAATWRRLDRPALEALLRQPAALATAFERTVGWRGPAA